jgi:hypothetical protein
MTQHYRLVIQSRGCHHLVLLISVISAVTTVSCAPPGKQDPVTQASLSRVSVCELLQNPGSYTGKRIAVRGIYWHGLREACPTKFVTAGHTWPSAIDLTDSRQVANTKDAVPFNTDQQSWDKLDELVLREAKAAHREEIWATVVGTLRAPASYIRDNGEVTGGYGHLGVFPAQLIVERVEEVSIQPSPTYDYSELLKPGEGAPRGH